MADLQELLSKLNPEQVKPVLETEGAVLVIAGAGSGKTRVLTSRIVYLLQEKNVYPSNILAITFTNKAAGEMKKRLSEMCGDVSEMWISTIHSMCVRILRSAINRLGYDKNFTIYDETDKDKVMKRVIEDLGLEVDKYFKYAKNIISEAKNEAVEPEFFSEVYCDLKIVDEICAIYKSYQSTLEHTNALDFDDLLFLTYKLFKENPDVADYYADKFQYIHIDEFQDINKVQFAIAQRLSIKHGNIFVVGDDDQSIYGWRGAKVENIIHFDDIYRGAKVYKLEQNYRSSKKILSLANCIIKNNANRREKELWTENDEGVKIDTYVADNEQTEASYVALQIKSLVNRGTANYSDFAVFMRLNALSRAFEQEFANYSIPYKVYGGFRFFERKEIKDVLSYLKLVNNTRDDEAFIRSVGVPKRGIGEKSLTELREFAVSRSLSMFEAIDIIGGTTLSSGTIKKLNNYKNMIEDFINYSKNHTPLELICYVLTSTSFMDMFNEKSEENESRRANISELQNSADMFAKENPNTTLADYLNSVTLSSDTDDINDDNVVTIATIHAVKGLEYKNVFVAGLDESVLPGSRALGDDDELEEERRLMYVAITRARERLTLTRAMSRFMYGRREFMRPSRFLKEGEAILKPKIFEERSNQGTYDNYRYNFQDKPRYVREGYGDAFIDDSRPTDNFRYSSSSGRKFVEGTKPKENGIKNYGSFKSGIKVRHPKFGEGTVIQVKGSGDNSVVDVAFKGVGIKSLSLKYAPLEIL